MSRPEATMNKASGISLINGLQTLKRHHIDIITLGCSKNLVDSEVLMKQLEACGYTCSHDSDDPQGDIAVINTCGFIADAKQESIDTILAFAQAKDEGRLKRLYVMGCLSERYRDVLEKEIPQVDKYYGKFDFKNLLADLGNANAAWRQTERHLTTPGHYAYVKISEGCDRHCAYCAIPLITGRQASRRMDEILSETRTLAASGVKEFQIVAQDLTDYGTDLYGKQSIATLISNMAAIDGVEWIRLHYAYPARFPYELLDVIRDNANVCKYLDIAFQHISDRMLTAMRRHITAAETVQLIRRIRREVPGICLRTTLMVGFPGETDDDFRQLMDFTRQMRFERMGAFAYSEEEGTYSADNYADDVPDDVKRQRLDSLMMLQQGISAEILNASIGTVQKVIIDRREGDYYVARSQFSSPEVDPEVLIPANGEPLLAGTFYDVRITGAEEYDLYADIVAPSSSEKEEKRGGK